jgi:hypothetical protein
MVPNVWNELLFDFQPSAPSGNDLTNATVSYKTRTVLLFIDEAPFQLFNFNDVLDISGIFQSLDCSMESVY